MQSKVSYIIGFCVAVCLVCSVFVSLAAVGLKDRQETNKLLDRQKKVLTVAGLIDADAQVSPEEIQSLFSSRIRSVVVDLRTGTVDSETDPATYDQMKAAKDDALSDEVDKNPAGVPRVPHRALVYQMSTEAIAEGQEAFSVEAWIFPIHGKGLWSTLYGYISLAPDFNQVRGLIFYQHAETPGLGGEVDNKTWLGKWPNRLVYGPAGTAFDPTADNAVQLRVIKGTAGSIEEAPHSVDGLSGATITSNGVSHSLDFWLGGSGFGSFIKNQLAATAAVQAGGSAP